MRLRRLSAAKAAMCAALAAILAVTITHNHQVVGFIWIGMQAVLLVISLTLLARSKRLAAEKQN